VAGALEIQAVLTASWFGRERGRGAVIHGTIPAAPAVGGDMAYTELDRLTSGVPKVIDPKMHAVLDYMTAGTFLTMGFAWMRSHPRASTLAFMNGGSVLAASLFTNYPGGVWRKMSFETHGLMDVVQAGLSAAGPALFGFARDAEAQFFHGQAALEAGVVATTNFSAAA
jgi:hypothetical protein